MTWLKGGPFLEVGFLLPLDTDRMTLILHLLDELKRVIPVELVITQQDLKIKIQEFVKGYPDDKNDPNSSVYHSLEIPLYVDIDGKRKSVLSVEQISDNLIIVDFWFYGDELDAPEWDQRGITQRQLPDFKNLLIKLFDIFYFPVGTLGFEVTTIDLFRIDKGWPDKSYNLENIRSRPFNVNDFIMVVTNKKYFDMKDVGEIRSNGQKQIFEGD